MEYNVDIVINAPRSRVMELFLDAENQQQWQPDLLEWELTSGTLNAPGSKMRLVHKMGRGQIDMVQTVIENRAPDFVSATYEADGVWNLVENTFEDRGDQTYWRVDTEFKCEGLMIRLMTIFAPWMFRRQTRSFMQMFKAFVES